MTSSRIIDEIERRVFGTPTGATGYTTERQARELATALGARSGLKILDLGSGNGWPALHIAKLSGCSVVLSDVPRPAIVEARSRALRAGSQERCDAVLASGAALPFRARSFDGVTHADVTC